MKVFKMHAPLIALLVVSVAAYALGDVNRFESIKEKKAKEEYGARQVRDKLTLIDKLFPVEKVDELFKLTELKQGNCNHLNKLNDFIESPKLTGAPKRYFESARNLLVDYCNLIEVSAEKNFLILADSKQLVENLFGEMLRAKSDEIKLSQLDAQHAAQLLGRGGRELDANRLIKVASNADKCQVEELHFILDTTFKSLINNWPIKTELQNLVVNQIELCPSDKVNQNEIVQSLKSRVSLEVRQVVEELGKQLISLPPTGNNENQKFAQVVEAIERIVSTTKDVNIKDKLTKKRADNDVYKSYGKQLGEACASIRRKFNLEANVLRIFFGKTKLEELSKWLRIVEACFYVPDYLNENLQINEATELSLNESHKLAVKLGSALGLKGNSYETSRKQSSAVSESSFTRVFIEQIENFYCTEKENELDEEEQKKLQEKIYKNEYVNLISNNCANYWPMRKALFWMSRVGYPFQGNSKKYLEQLVVVQKVCETLDSIDFYALKSKVYDKFDCSKTSLIDKLRGITLLKGK